MQKVRNLNTKLVAAETSANELQKKYDESKRNYLRIRDERERLKSDLEAAKSSGGATTTSGAISTGEASAAGAPADSNMTANKTGGKPQVNAALNEVQAKYEGLKTKLKVSSIYCISVWSTFKDIFVRFQLTCLINLSKLCG